MGVAMTEIPFDSKPLQKVFVNLRSVENSVDLIISSIVKKQTKAQLFQWTLKALSLTDLTTLAGDDTECNVDRLCFRAAFPFPERFVDEKLKGTLHTAAVCVYPARVENAYKSLERLGKLGQINIASVATGFPSGQYPLSTRLEEIKFAVSKGATEIDIVVDRGLVLNGKWQELYSEIVQMRHACGDKVHLKTILGIGECGTMVNVYKASMVAMQAGSDFIKTSTGKETVNATLTVGLVMVRAIQEFYRITGKKIGLKPAGGVKTVKDAVAWMVLIQETLGSEWLSPHLFRFGASGLLDDIEMQYLKLRNQV